MCVAAFVAVAGFAVAAPAGQAADAGAAEPSAQAAAKKRCKTKQRNGVRTRTCKVRGRRGRRGRTGRQGAIGPQGVQGLPGVPGPQGPGGPQGPAGAQGAQGPAGAGGGTTLFDEAGAGTVTEELDYEQVAGGPTVTITVPASGNIFVAASIVTDGDIAVALFEDGTNVSLVECSGPGPELFETASGGPSPTTWGTPGVPNFTGSCSTFGSPSGVLLHTTPGAHTYELRYAVCGCGGGPQSMDQRRLWITTLP